MIFMIIKILYICYILDFLLSIVVFLFAGSEEFYKCDLVLLAMGFLGPEKSVIKELNMDCDPRSNMKTPKNKYHTSVPKVYAAGDCR